MPVSMIAKDWLPFSREQCIITPLTANPAGGPVTIEYISAREVLLFCSLRGVLSSEKGFLLIGDWVSTNSLSCGTKMMSFAIRSSRLSFRLC